MASNCVICGPSLVGKQRSHAQACPATCGKRPSRRSEVGTPAIVGTIPTVGLERPPRGTPPDVATDMPLDHADWERLSTEQSRRGSVSALQLWQETRPVREQQCVG